MAMNYRWQYTKTQRDIKTWIDAVDLTVRSVPAKKAGLKIAHPLLSSAMRSLIRESGAKISRLGVILFTDFHIDAKRVGGASRDGLPTVRGKQAGTACLQ